MDNGFQYKIDVSTHSNPTNVIAEIPSFYHQIYF